jgi:hypoxanthine phosphoribosyltransferase
MNITYTDIEMLTDNLYNKIKISFTPELVVGIGTGGWLPAKLINNKFKVELDTIKLSSYNGNQQGEIKESSINILNTNNLRNKKILVIDDVNDTGETLKYIIELLSSLTNELHIGVLHHKDKTKALNLFLNKRCVYHYAEIIGDVWVHYPWDKDN